MRGLHWELLGVATAETQCDNWGLLSSERGLLGMGTRVSPRKALSAASTCPWGARCSCTQPWPLPAVCSGLPSDQFRSNEVDPAPPLPFLHPPIDSALEREISIFHLLGFPQIPREK